MLKKTLFFTQPADLKVHNGQILIRSNNSESIVSPEDVGVVVFENPQICFSHSVINRFVSENVAVIFCDSNHLPQSLLYPLNSHSSLHLITSFQLKASEVLKKNLWKQTISAKIHNQAMLLKKLNLPFVDLMELAKNITAGDKDNKEAYAARIYWKRLFAHIDNFTREREGVPPNNALNYGYTILRALVARALSASGLLPVLGIHHKNRNNAFCLADDIMEPFRVFVDEIVYAISLNFFDNFFLTKEIKVELLKVMTVDTFYDNVIRPLSVGVSITTASLAKCFAGEQRKIAYPYFK